MSDTRDDDLEGGCCSDESSEGSDDDVHAGAKSDTETVNKSGSESQPRRSESDEDGEDGVCAVRLTSFQDGDIYGQSSNPSCRHIFHQDCIVGWLLTRDDGTCPCCRQPYLTPISTSS